MVVEFKRKNIKVDIMALTLRPTGEELEELEKLKEYLNIRSSSKIISFLIADYIGKDKTLAVTRRELSESERKLNTLLSLIKQKKETEMKIADILEQS